MNCSEECKRPCDQCKEHESDKTKSIRLLQEFRDAEINFRNINSVYNQGVIKGIELAIKVLKADDLS